jgi:hypothetical protein
VIREAIADNMRLIIWWLFGLLAFAAFVFSLTLIPSSPNPERVNCENLGGFYDSGDGTCEILEAK